MKKRDGVQFNLKEILTVFGALSSFIIIYIGIYFGIMSALGLSNKDIESSAIASFEPSKKIIITKK